MPGLVTLGGNPTQPRQRGMSDNISLTMNPRQSSQIQSIGQLISNNLIPNQAIQIQTQMQNPAPITAAATQVSPSQNTLQLHEQHMVNHKGSPPSLSKAQLPKFKFTGSKAEEEEEKENTEEPLLVELE